MSPISDTQTPGRPVVHSRTRAAIDRHFVDKLETLAWIALIVSFSGMGVLVLPGLAALAIAVHVLVKLGSATSGPVRRTTAVAGLAPILGIGSATLCAVRYICPEQ